MKKLVLSILFLATFLSSCSYVSPSEVGVKVYTLGSDKGEFEILGVGRYWIGIHQELYLYPINNLSYRWTAGNDFTSEEDESFTIQDKDGMEFKRVDIGIEFHIVPDSAIHIYKMYRKGINEFTDYVLRNRVSTAFINTCSKMDAVSILQNKQEILKTVIDKVREESVKDGVIVDNIYWISGLTAPAGIQEAIDMKVKAQQKSMQRENEIQQVIAEAKKEIEKAKGDSAALMIRAISEYESNKKISQSLTDELIKLKYIEKWNGVEPTTILGDTKVIKGL